MTLLPPHRAHSRREQAAATGATCPCRRTARGTGANHPSCPRPRFKSPRLENHGRQATNPIGVFYSPPSLLAPGKKGKGARRHRAAPGKEGAGNEEPGARSREQGPELRKTIASVDIYTAGNAYIAPNIFATPPTTPSRPRVHRRPTMSTARPIYSLLPLDLFLVMNRGVVLGAVGDPRVESLPPGEPQPPPVKTWVRRCTAPPQRVPKRFVEHLVCMRTLGGEANWEVARRPDLGPKPS
jgi:hypothetical protein